MTLTKAEQVRDDLKTYGIEAWTEQVTPNRHGYAVVFTGVSAPRDTVVQIGKRVALTPEEGDALLAGLQSGEVTPL